MWFGHCDHKVNSMYMYRGNLHRSANKFVIQTCRNLKE